MRLIDADKMKADLLTVDPRFKTMIDWCITVLDAQPTIEPKRNNGEWIPSFNGRFTGGAYWFHCSKCERIVPDVRNGGWNFCPNCGANMMGD